MIHGIYNDSTPLPFARKMMHLPLEMGYPILSTHMMFRSWMRWDIEINGIHSQQSVKKGMPQKHDE